MATSGTVGQTTIDVATMLEHAFRRAGLSPADQTPDAMKSAKENLYFYLSALSNDGVNLWTIEKVLIGMQTDKANYPIGIGTVDLKNILRRTISYPTGGTAYSSAGGSADYAFDRNMDSVCTQTSADGYIYYEFDSSTTITVVGLMPNGNKTYTLVWEGSEDGVTWTEVYASGEADYVDRQWTYYDIPSPRGFSYFRVRETGGGTLDVIQVSFGTVTLEIPVPRINIDQYTNLTNKTFSSAAVQQCWFNRKIDNPEILVWPTPSDPWQLFVVWRTRQIQDVGTLTNTLEIPQRWIDAAITGLAAKMILELPNVDSSRYDILKKEAEAATFRAQQEERDRSPIFFSPNIGVYTR